MISIYRKTNNVEAEVCVVSDKGATHKTAIMGIDEFQISVVVDEVLNVKEGDYIKLNDVHYTLNRDAEFTKVSDVQYNYELIFEHPIYTLLDKLFVHRVSGLSNFMLTGKLRDFVELLVWCVNKTADNPLGVDTGWTVGNVIDTEFRNIVFTDLSCREVLNLLANEFNAEYFTNNKQLNFVDRIENATGLVFEQGAGKGLYSITQRNVDKGDTVTRIYPRGGNKNVPNQYADGEGHLILPEKYLENFSEHSKVVEKNVTFDDEFPHFLGKVATATGTDNVVLTCPQIDFDVQAVAVGDNARINFLTGDLMGVSFKFQWNNANKQITLIKQDDETALPGADGNKPQIPNASKKAKVTDSFNFTGLFMPESYVIASQTRLRAKAQSYLEFYSRKRVKFDLSVDYRFMRGKQELKAGDLVTIHIPQKNLSKLIRITTLDKNLFTGAISCTVSNYLDEKWEKKIETQISSLASSIGNDAYNAVEKLVDILQQYDSRTPSDRNLFSSLRTLFEIRNRAISKETNDVASGLIKFLQGLEIGTYTQGTLGGGGAFKMVDGISELEVDRLTVRMVATFFELVISKLSHIGGQLVLTPARMKCTKVEDGGSYYRCYFDEGTNGEVANEFVVGDQARCQVFTGSGAKFYWRLVTSVGQDWINLSKTDCVAGSAVPEAGDEIVQLGNRTDTNRQSAQILSTTGSDAPSYKQYGGINSFSLEGKELTVFSSRGNKIHGSTTFTSGGQTIDEWANSTASDIQSAKDALFNVELQPNTLIIPSNLAGVADLTNAEFDVFVRKEGKEVFPAFDLSLGGRNLVRNSLFRDNLEGWWGVGGLIRAENNELTLTNTESHYSYIMKTVNLISGHKYYQSLYQKLSANGVLVRIRLYNSTLLENTINSPSGGSWYRNSFVTEANSTGESYFFAQQEYSSAEIASGKVMTVKEPTLIDLTAMFGVGNEPSTTECDNIFSKFTPAPEDLLTSAVLTPLNCSCAVVGNKLKITSITPGTKAGYVDVLISFGDLSQKKRFTWTLVTDTKEALEELEIDTKNHIRNGNFTNGLSDWNVNYDSASGQTRPETTLITAGINLPTVALGALKVVANAVNQGVWQNFRDAGYPKLELNKPYTLSFLLKKEGSATFYFAFGHDQLGQIRAITKENEWERHTYTFTPTEHNNIYFYAQQASTFYITNIQVIQGTTAQPFRNGYLERAIEQDGLIRGGLTLATVIGARDNGEVKAYMSGLADNPTAFAAGVEHFGTQEEKKNIDIKHDGSAKIGVLEVQQDTGTVTVKDKADKNLERLKIHSDVLPSVVDLLNSTVQSGTLNCSNFGRSGTIPETVFLTSEYIDLVRPNNNITLSARIQLNVPVNADFNILIGIYKQNAQGVYEKYYGNSIISHGYNMGSSAIISDENKTGVIYNVPGGRYKISINHNLNNISSLLISNLKLNYIANNDVRRIEYGANGLMAFYAYDGQKNFLHITENDGLQVGGKVDMPGVLASGRVGTTNNHTQQWGAKKSTANVSYTATGIYNVPHNAGSTYMVLVQAEGDGVHAYVISQGNNTFRVQLRNHAGNPVAGYFNYTIFGNN